MGLSYKTIILLALFATTVDKFIFTPESFKTPPKSICMRFMGSSSVLSVEFIPFRFIFEHSIGFLGLSLPEFWSQMSWVGPRSRSAEKVQVDRVDFRELVLDDYWTVFNNFRCFGKLRFRTFFSWDFEFCWRGSYEDPRGSFLVRLKLHQNHGFDTMWLFDNCEHCDNSRLNFLFFLISIRCWESIPEHCI